MNTFLFFRYANRMLYFFFLFSLGVQILKTEYKYGQYCTPLSQSDCRYFFMLAIKANMTHSTNEIGFLPYLLKKPFSTFFEKFLVFAAFSFSMFSYCFKINPFVFISFPSFFTFCFFSFLHI